jgi:lipopolysaccharide heptosyltransferase II
VRIGFANARELAWLFYTHRVAVNDRNMHAVDRNYLFADLLGFGDVPIAMNLPVSEQARQRVHHLLEGEGIKPEEPYVVMAPGTRWETKIWSTDRFGEVARRMMQGQSIRVVLVGMDSEKPLSQAVAQRADGGVVDLAGRTNLSELIALIDGAAGVVMHDSGPMHLAAALNKPMVAIYGPTSPQLTGPYRRPDAIAQHNVDCSPCRIKNVADCPYAHRCMRDLDVETVLEKVNRMLTATEASL